MDEEKKVIIKLHKEPLASERAEIRAKRMKRLAVVLCCIAFFIVGLILGGLLRTISYVETIDSSNYSILTEVQTYFDRYWLYKNEYEDLDGLLKDKALYGMTSFADDPYTTYMSADEMKSFSSGINMDFVGIGVYYDNEDGIAQVTRVIKGSPAEAAGIMAGDIIRKVDGVSCDGLSSEEIKAMVVGEEGTAVDITIDRGGQELTLTCVRARVDSTVYAYAKNDYVVLELLSFGDNTANECIRYLNEYQDYSKLIIDLRSNGGGYQDALQAVAGLFIGPNKTVMYQTTNDGTRREYLTTASVYYANFEEIVIITDGQTASAAEVLTICLREQHDNVTVVGETTYGKGVVQSSVILKDGSALKITTSKWESPQGICVNGNGIEPDVEVLLPEIFYAPLYNMTDEDIYELDDVSLYVENCQKALDYLGYTVARSDGYFDISTQEAIKAFQSDHSIEGNGKIDKKTYNALVSQVTSVYKNDVTMDAQMMAAIEIISK